MAIFASLSLVEREIGPQLALLVVAAAGAERVPQAALGDLRVGGRRRDHQHAVVGVDFRGGNGHAGVEVADDELDAVADELVGDRDALLGIGDVVALFDRRSCWPRMPPAALKSATACATPLVNCAPNEALGPVIGPATPILICASAAPAKARPAASTRPVNQYFFILHSLSFGDANSAPRRKLQSHLGGG